MQIESFDHCPSLFDYKGVNTPFGLWIIYLLI